MTRPDWMCSLCAVFRHFDFVLAAAGSSGNISSLGSDITFVFWKTKTRKRNRPGGQERCEKVAVTLQGTLGYRCENFVGR